jgi:hypothetical protein
VTSLSVPSGVNAVSVFEPASNVGITAFEIRSMPAAPLVYEAYLEVSNFGKESRGVDLTVSGGGEHRITRNVRIASGGTYREAMDLSSFDGGPVQGDADALPLDDVAFAYLPVKRRVRTLLVTSGNGFLQTVLKAHPLLDLSTTTPAAYTSASSYDMVVFDRFAPQSPPSLPALIVGSPPAPWLPPHKQAGNASSVSFETWTEEHPLLRGLSLHDVY